jgi:ribulose-5-phosphate 4-epimerase/fuculose-1-phosphate aldolase
MSRRAGERFDLVQAGGGNTSAKLADGKMYVKASGLRLSDLISDQSFVLIENSSLRKKVSEINWYNHEKRDRERIANEVVSEFNLTPDRRPSIETLLHSFLEGYVLHTHPIQVLSWFSVKEAERRVSSYFPESAFVPYQTPGVELALVMLEAKNNYEKRNNISPKSFIFQNHGLVTIGETWLEAFDLSNMICDKIAKLTELDFEFDKQVNVISNAMEEIFKETFVTIHCSENLRNRESMTQLPFFPDGVVFLGLIPIILNEMNLESVSLRVKNYKEEHSVLPRVFIYLNHIYFTGKTFSKAKESEEVWKMHEIACKFKPSSLSSEEISFLSHWEAEKYRQKI